MVSKLSDKTYKRVANVCVISGLISVSLFDKYPDTAITMAIITIIISMGLYLFYGGKDEDKSVS